MGHTHTSAAALNAIISSIQRCTYLPPLCAYVSKIDGKRGKRIAHTHAQQIEGLFRKFLFNYRYFKNVESSEIYYYGIRLKCFDVGVKCLLLCVIVRNLPSRVQVSKLPLFCCTTSENESRSCCLRSSILFCSVCAKTHLCSVAKKKEVSHSVHTLTPRECKRANNESTTSDVAHRQNDMDMVVRID